MSVTSPYAASGARPSYSIRERAARVRFRRAVSLMVMTLFLPGSAQVLAGNRRLGWWALRVWCLLVAVVVGALVASALKHEIAFYLLSNTWLLLLARIVLSLAAIGWVGLFMDAWRLGNPLSLLQRQRLAAVSVNGFLSMSMAGVLLFGAHLVTIQRDFILTMFGSGSATGAHHGRYNVLLLGGDSGAGRWGLRPDSMTIASIDAVTGKSVLISLPRNMQNFPFREGSVMAKQFPKGFNLDGQYLNGVSTWAQDHASLFKKSENPGVDATISAVEGITGLRINYWAMVNLQGFRELVDAVGGVELNVRQAIPVGLPSDSYFHYVQPGVRKLNGQDTLWFARARYDSDDYSRMARQKCVMGAMLNQISPQVAVRNFQDIASASASMVSTNLPAGELDRFMALALKAKSQKISTLSLVPPMIVTADPDIALVQSKVAEAIAASEGKPPTAQDLLANAPVSVPASPATPTPTAPAKPKKKKQDDTVTGGSKGSLKTGYAANQATDLLGSC